MRPQSILNPYFLCQTISAQKETNRVFSGQAVGTTLRFPYAPTQNKVGPLLIPSWVLVSSRMRMGIQPPKCVGGVCVCIKWFITLRSPHLPAFSEWLRINPELNSDLLDCPVSALFPFLFHLCP